MPRPSDPNAKEKLLRAAEAEFAEKGLVRAKVEDITARAGLSKGSFYLHFQSKEDAFRNLVEGVLSRLGCFVDGEEMSAQELERLCGAPAALIEDWQSRDLETFEFIWQNRGLMGVVMEGGGGADYRHLVDTFADRAASRIAERLQRGVSFGVYSCEATPQATQTQEYGRGGLTAPRTAPIPPLALNRCSPRP